MWPLIYYLGWTAGQWKAVDRVQLREELLPGTAHVHLRAECTDPDAVGEGTSVEESYGRFNGEIGNFAQYALVQRDRLLAYSYTPLACGSPDCYSRSLVSCVRVNFHLQMKFIYCVRSITELFNQPAELNGTYVANCYKFNIEQSRNEIV